MALRALIFDVDGTLADTERVARCERLPAQRQIRDRQASAGPPVTIEIPRETLPLRAIATIAA